MLSKSLLGVCGGFLLGASGAVVAAAPVVQNASFENPSTTQSYGPIDNWTQAPFPSGLNGFDYLSGEHSTSGFSWDNGVVPGEGTAGKVGFIQVFPSVSTLSLQQTVSGFDPAQTYQLTYFENSRAGTSVPLVEVLVGGQVVVAQHLDPAVDPAGTYVTPFRTVTSIPFTVPSGSAVVELRVQQQNSGDDATATFDDVSISAVPEPASIGLLGAGLIGLLARRRV